MLPMLSNRCYRMGYRQMALDVFGLNAQTDGARAGARERERERFWNFCASIGWISAFVDEIKMKINMRMPSDDWLYFYYCIEFPIKSARYEARSLICGSTQKWLSTIISSRWFSAIFIQPDTTKWIIISIKIERITFEWTPTSSSDIVNISQPIWWRRYGIFSQHEHRHRQNPFAQHSTVWLAHK